MDASLALAMLRAGRSFDEAAKASGMTVAAVMELWRAPKAGRLPAE